MYVGFIDLEKAYDRVNREALSQVLRMYDVVGKLLGGIKSMYVDRLACVRVKLGVSKRFRIDSGVRQGCIMSSYLFSEYMECSDERGENGDGKDGRECRLPGLLYADDLVICGESEEDLRVMVGQFGEVCRRGLKVSTSKSKAMVLGGKEMLKCEVCIDGICLEHVSEFKYLGMCFG